MVFSVFKIHSIQYRDKCFSAIIDAPVASCTKRLNCFSSNPVKMETLLEQQRRYHEEKERLMDAMTKEMLHPTKTVGLKDIVINNMSKLHNILI